MVRNLYSAWILVIKFISSLNRRVVPYSKPIVNLFVFFREVHTIYIIFAFVYFANQYDVA